VALGVPGGIDRRKDMAGTNGQRKAGGLSLEELGVSEKRAMLAGVRSLPLHNDFEAVEDQPVRFTGVGTVKGIVRRRDRSGAVWKGIYEVQVTSVDFDALQEENR
jgi:hypothetical protein